MAEVVSVSDPSPLEAFSTGLNMLEFSLSQDWSGTGITPTRTKTTTKQHIFIITSRAMHYIVKSMWQANGFCEANRLTTKHRDLK